MTQSPEMPVPQSSIAIVTEWIAKAYGDVRVAQRENALGSKGSTDAVTFHCQQAIEKLLKGLLAKSGTEPPHIHDLPQLSRLVREIDPRWDWSIDELRFLSFGAVQSRYPGTTASLQDSNEAFALTLRMWIAISALY
jgi:HEPN domain-containing protein